MQYSHFPMQKQYFKHPESQEKSYIKKWIEQYILERYYTPQIFNEKKPSALNT